MSPPLFSIVIPCYNYAHTLERAVTSVMGQSFADYELLVINDGSTDDTDQVAAELAQKYPDHFRYLRTQNSGPAATRNLGIAKTSGRYLIFLDADDELHPQALENLKIGIEKNPEAGLIAGAHRAIEPNGNSRLHQAPTFPDSRIKRIKYYLVDKKTALSNGAVAMSRRIFHRYLYPEKFRSCEDIPMFAYVLANYEVVAVPDLIVLIHKHHDSLRHNIGHQKRAHKKLVNETFSPQRMPLAAMKLKEKFAAQCHLSLSRSSYLAGNPDDCIRFYRKALSAYPRFIFKLPYTRKVLKAWLHKQCEIH